MLAIFSPLDFGLVNEEHHSAEAYIFFVIWRRLIVKTILFHNHLLEQMFVGSHWGVASIGNTSRHGRSHYVTTIFGIPHTNDLFCCRLREQKYKFSDCSRIFAEEKLFVR